MNEGKKKKKKKLLLLLLLQEKQQQTTNVVLTVQCRLPGLGFAVEVDAWEVDQLEQHGGVPLLHHTQQWCIAYASEQRHSRNRSQ
jgi:hypothetical protein